MNFLNTFLFISKSLTVSLEEMNRLSIETILKNDDVDFDKVVKLSTSHYVLPALYCNFKKTGFLKYLPIDLVNYMEYITDLNRERNYEIINQAKNLNKLLLGFGIKPIFLKGTANILQGLYDDIAERMVGDIDLIVSKDKYQQTISILLNNGYTTEIGSDKFLPIYKHFPRLIKEGNIAAIEVHKEMIDEKYSKEFNFDLISDRIQDIKGFSILSYKDQLNLSILSFHIEDYGYDYKTISLRNAYDVFLFSKKTDAKKGILGFNKLRHPLNCFLASCYFSFGEVSSLKFQKTKEVEYYMLNKIRLLNSDSRRNLRNKLIKIKYI